MVWARATRGGFDAAGWWFTSLAEAVRVAEERVRLLVDVLIEAVRDRRSLPLRRSPVR